MPVRPAWLREPWRTDPARDCWMIWLLAGDLEEAMAKLPDQRPFMAYERENVLRVFPMKRIWRGLKLGIEGTLRRGNRDHLRVSN